ncbi:MAG: sulfatase-like hydrolase/transferase [Armatimonadota bacterium]|jgi:arylsulfatase A-like enzyme
MAAPNILLIVADDMGYGDFGVFNEGLSETPHLDALAAEGRLLTQHYAGSCVCAPSRAALLTGRYPHRTGSIDTREARGTDRLGLWETTLAERLAAEGYVTGLVGKWHLGELDRRYLPQSRGFDEVCAFRGGWEDYWRWWLDYGGGWFRRSDGGYLTDTLTDEACGFIRRHRDEPFFLYLAYNCPHTPLQAPESDIAPFRGRDDVNDAVATLYGMIRRMDRGIGHVLETLEWLGLAEDTIVLFTSDNGPQFGSEIGRIERHNCGFAGHKGNIYEGGIRVPMIVRWPESIEPGRCDEMVHFCDWTPTLLSAVGAQPQQEPAADGANILPVLRGESADVPDRRFWQWNRYRPVGHCNAAMRDGDWKLVRAPMPQCFKTTPEDHTDDHQLRDRPGYLGEVTDRTPPERDVSDPPPAQLFNIAQDPAEAHDLAEQEPRRAARMEGELAAWFEEVESERLSHGVRPG